MKCEGECKGQEKEKARARVLVMWMGASERVCWG